MPMSKDRKKITFNALLNHKAHNYKPMQIEVEKVISLYGKRFEQMKNHPLDDCPEIIENRELIAAPVGYIIATDIALVSIEDVNEQSFASY